MLGSGTFLRMAHTHTHTHILYIFFGTETKRIGVLHADTRGRLQFGGGKISLKERRQLQNNDVHEKWERGSRRLYTRLSARQLESGTTKLIGRMPQDSWGKEILQILLGGKNSCACRRSRGWVWTPASPTACPGGLRVWRLRGERCHTDNKQSCVNERERREEERKRKTQSNYLVEDNHSQKGFLTLDEATAKKSQRPAPAARAVQEKGISVKHTRGQANQKRAKIEGTEEGGEKTINKSSALYSTRR